MDLRFKPNRKYKITRQEISRLRIPTPPDAYIDEGGNLIDFDTNYKEEIKERLSVLLNPRRGIIDGDKVKRLIFPTAGYDFPDFDVFISHSHNDKEKAERLAKYLRFRYGKEPFLDNYVWSSADGLLKEIDRRYCMTEDGSLYDYEKRNFSTSHVHTMLSMAILEMIARCESFIFIESIDSIDYTQLRDNGHKTQSPWLFQELQYARMLSVAARRQLNEQREFSDIRDSLRIQYGAQLNDFIRLTATSFNIFED